MSDLHHVCGVARRYWSLQLAGTKRWASDLGVHRAFLCVVWVKYIDLVPLTPHFITALSVLKVAPSIEIWDVFCIPPCASLVKTRLE